MKILVKGGKKTGSQGECSVIVVSDPKKQKEVMRLLTATSYTKAIKFLLSCAERAESFPRAEDGKQRSVNLVLTPNSVHWDLVGK